MELFVFLLIDFHRLNLMFGEGNWVMHIDCPSGPPTIPWIYHHYKYHEK